MSKILLDPHLMTLRWGTPALGMSTPWIWTLELLLNIPLNYERFRFNMILSSGCLGKMSQNFSPGLYNMDGMRDKACGLLETWGQWVPLNNVDINSMHINWWCYWRCEQCWIICNWTSRYMYIRCRSCEWVRVTRTETLQQYYQKLLSTSGRFTPGYVVKHVLLVC